ncbi:unnamed protein product [Microthlaspi erraticum]|uniref:PPM-type phosphatase domain-containing protein n=1 Tax=Microthlaspi erraticum TaxID=1685480 RepID=A0A6D2KKG1_9BRAS|nr:unnamed protein product [Microthlaspi erraticum]
MENCEEKEEKEDEAFRAAYLKTESDFFEKVLKSSACFVTVLIQDQEMIVSSLGDCRAVLCGERGVFEALASDHKAAGTDQGGHVAVFQSIKDANLKKWVIGEHKTLKLKIEDRYHPSLIGFVELLWSL